MPKQSGADDGDRGIVSEPEVIVGPDGGWGWIVCFASFTVNFLVDGIIYSFGIFYLELLDYFNDSRAKTAWVGSTLVGVSMLMGPVVSFLLHYLTCRQVVISGSVIAAAGFIASIFAPSIDVLIVTYGIIGGCGLSFMFLTSIIAVGLYFNSRRALATGIATSGSGLGTIAFSFFTGGIIELFSWKGAMLIIAGIVLNGVVCGALYRQLKKREKSEKEIDTSEYSGENEVDTLLKSKSTDFINKLDYITDDSRSASLNFLQSHHRKLNENVIRPRSMHFLQPSKYENVPRLAKSIDHLANINGARSPCLSAMDLRNNVPFKRSTHLSPLCRKDIYYGGSIVKLPEYKSSQNITQFIHSMVNSRTEEALDDSASISESFGNRRSKCCRSRLNPRILKSRCFWIYLATCCFWTAHGATLTFIPSLGTENGLSRTEASMLLACAGVTNIIGRVLAGVVTDLLHVSSGQIYICALFVAAATNAVLPFCNTFALLAACSTVFGLCMSCWVSLRTIVLVDLVGIDNLTQGFGLIGLFQGIAFTLNPPIAGWLFDMTDSYLLTFEMAACSYFIAACMFLPVYFIKMRGRSMSNDVREMIVIATEDTVLPVQV